MDVSKEDLEAEFIKIYNELKKIIGNKELQKVVRHLLEKYKED